MHASRKTLRLTATASLALLASLSGCASSAAAYRWADYESELYGFYLGHDHGERLGAALQALIARTEAQHRMVAPGLYAEYGYLQFRKGQLGTAIDMYHHELARWPESRVLVERLLADAEAVASRQASVPAPPAGPAVVNIPGEQGSPGDVPLHSILVLAVASAGVPDTVTDLFLAGTLRPLAARGYYVFPVNVVRAVFAGEGYLRGPQRQGVDPGQMGRLVGADAVLLLRVDSFESAPRASSTAVAARLDYQLYDVRSGARLWTSTRDAMYVAPQSAGGGMAAGLDERIDATLFHLAPQYIALARGTSGLAIHDELAGLAAGPYAGEMDWILGE
jgi:hypothetical protein